LLVIGEVAALADTLQWFGQHQHGLPGPQALAA